MESAGSVEERVDALVTAGLFLQAHTLASAVPADRWSTQLRSAISRVAYHLGAPTFARWVDVEAYRRAPKDAVAIVEYAGWLLGRRGPYETYRWLSKRTPEGETPDRVWNRHLHLRAYCAAMLRDFELAERLLGEARQRDVHHELARAEILELSDRRSEALALAEKFLDVPEGARQALPLAARLLVALNRESDALSLLVEREPRFECPQITMQLSTLQQELRLFEDERRTLDRWESMLVLAESAVLDTACARRCDNAYARGDRTLALTLARKCSQPFFQKLAANLADPKRSDKLVRLDVELVRQHHMTCAPATLTSVARFFGRNVDHLSVAEEICYDGTPAHFERDWAHRNNWAAREFTLTREAAHDLLDRGIPFTLSLNSTASAHLVAVIGYDDRRGTLFFRDPAEPVVSEVLTDMFLEHHAPYGPRAMVMVPKSRAGEVPELPDERLFDRLDEVNAALVAHDRPAAERALEALRGAAPRDRITLHARRALASYDGNDVEMMAVAEDLLALHPRNVNAEVVLLQSMKDLASRAEHLRRLEEAGERPDTDPLFLEMLGAALLEDARARPRARRLLRSAARARPDRALPLHYLGELEAARGAVEDAIELRRFASCLDDSNEALARSYFHAARSAGRTAEALEMLERRHARLSARAAGPTQTLFDALDDLEQTERGFRVLGDALRTRPEDGELLVFAAEAFARYGRTDEAMDRVRDARGRAPAKAVASAAAYVHRTRGEWELQLSALREQLDIEPDAISAHAALALRLSRTAGPAAVLAHLDAARARFPYHRGLARLAITWHCDIDARRADVLLREYLAISPSDAWAHRQLALAHSQAGRVDEALAACDAALALRPNEAAQYHVRGTVCLRAGRLADARESLHRAIEIEPDREAAIAELLGAPVPLEERIADLARVANVVLARTVNGHGALEWYLRGRSFLDANELLVVVERFASERPELWAAWSVHSQHLMVLERTTHAREIAVAGSTRFPMVPKLWVDLASAALAMDDTTAAIAALERALELNPAYVDAALERVRLLEELGEVERVERALERMLLVAPDSPRVQARIATSHFRLGQKQLAIDVLLKAVAQSPDEHRLWTLLHDYRHAVGEHTGALPELRAHAEARPWDTRTSILLGRLLRDGGDEAGALEVVRRVLSTDPVCIEAHDLHATIRARAGRYGEAMAACAPALPVPSFELAARAAEIDWAHRNFEAATQRLSDTLALHPDYGPGWTQLGSWQGQRGNHAEEARAAARLVQLAPDDAQWHGLLGDARASEGDMVAARASFLRALRLDPTEDLALQRMFELHFRDGELDAARSLARRQARAAPTAAALKELRVCLASNDDAGALEVMRRIARTTETSEGELRRARADLVLAGLGDQVQSLLREISTSESGCRAAGVLYVATREARGEHMSFESLPLASPSEAARGAVATVFQRLVEREETWRVRWWALRGIRSLRVAASDWASVGRALLVNQWPWLGVLWLSDWRSRAGLQPWMVSNQAWALRRLRLWRRSFRAHRAALALPPDGTTNDDKVYVAYDDATSGRTDDAASRITQVDLDTLDEFARSVLAMTRAMVEVQRRPRSSDAERRAAFQVGRQMMEQVSSLEALPAFSAFSSLWMRAARCVARDCRSVEAYLWAYRPAWIAALVPVGLVVGFLTTDARGIVVSIGIGICALAILQALVRGAWSRL